MKARLIVADDHQIVRQGLADLIARSGDLAVVAEAADGAEAERLARSVTAELLVLDIGLPVRRGLQVLEALRADGIGLPVLIFSMYPAAQYADYARRAGAQGFVGKDADSAELLRAIRRIVAGGIAFPGRPPRDPAGDPFVRLSRREFEVMEQLVAGRSLIDIAARLDITARSVTTYRRRLLEKLEVGSNVELARLAARHGHA